jgi:hypothetical protein
LPCPTSWASWWSTTCGDACHDHRHPAVRRPARPGPRSGWPGDAAIGQTGIPGGQQALAYLIFALIGTLGVGIPVGLYFAMGTRFEKLLAGLKDWMSAHNAVIMTVLCLIIGVKLIGDGIGGVTG